MMMMLLIIENVPATDLTLFGSHNSTTSSTTSSTS